MDERTEMPATIIYECLLNYKALDYPNVETNQKTKTKLSLANLN